MLALPVSWLLWQEVRAPGERFVVESDEFGDRSGRVPVWRTTASLIPSYAALGTGFGTFEDVFDFHRPPEVRQRWDHAPNDWLQWALEGGIPCALFALCEIGAACGIRPGGFVSPAGRSILATSVFAALLTMTLYGLVDFCLRIPANAMLFASILGVTGNVGWAPTVGPREPRRLS